MDCAQHRLRRRVVGVGGDPPHRAGDRRRHDLRGRRPERPRRRVDPHRELVRGDSGQRGGELVDRIVGPRHRRMAAGVGHVERVILARLLADRDREQHRLAALSTCPPPPSLSANAASISGRSWVLRYSAPLNALFVSSPQVSASLTVRRGRGLGAQPDQRVDVDRRHCLVVGRAAGVEDAVLLDQLEGVARPVRRLRLDDVEVGEEEDRLRPRVAARQDRDEAALLRMLGDGEAVEVGRRIARRRQPRRHPARRRGCTTPPTAWCWSRRAPGTSRGTRPRRGGSARRGAWRGACRGRARQSA